MNEMNERTYHIGRAEASRRLAAAAVDPAIAAIHRELADRYEANVLLASIASGAHVAQVDQPA